MVPFGPGLLDCPHAAIESKTLSGKTANDVVRMDMDDLLE
jgi:hypothetical protein